jgi:ABC-type nitrate/sulfonate/bicarbonate transport system substrate-binding protein
VTYREVPHPQMEDALRQKEIDAGYMVIPMSRSGLKTRSKGDLASLQRGSNAQFMHDRPETAAKFVRALRRGLEWYNANLGQPELLKIVSGFTRIDVDVLKRVPMAPSPLHVDPEADRDHDEADNRQQAAESPDRHHAADYRPGAMNELATSDRIMPESPAAAKASVSRLRSRG